MNYEEFERTCKSVSQAYASRSIELHEQASKFADSRNGPGIGNNPARLEHLIKGFQDRSTVMLDHAEAWSRAPNYFIPTESAKQ